MAETVGGASKELVAKLEELSEVLDRLEALDAKRKPLAEQEQRLREELLQAFSKAELNGAKAAGLRVSVTTARVPSLTDRVAFFQFATRKANWDLLSGSVNAAAWRDRVEAGKAVPGVEAFDRVGLRVNRV